MTCKYCITEIEDGVSYTDCPIHCLPIRGKWQRYTYGALKGIGGTQADIISRIKDDHPDEDVRQQYVQRAVKGLFDAGHIVRVYNDGRHEKMFASALEVENDSTDFCVSDEVKLSRKEIRQLIAYEILKTPAKDMPKQNVGHVMWDTSELYENIYSWLCAGFPEAMEHGNDFTTLYKMFQPVVRAAEDTLKTLRKTKANGSKFSCVRKPRGVASGILGFNRTYFQELWDSEPPTRLVQKIVEVLLKDDAYWAEKALRAKQGKATV